MKCERCGGKKTICNYEHPEGSEYCLKCKTCPDCHGTGTKPEPEHDEKLKKAFSIYLENSCINKSGAVHFLKSMNRDKSFPWYSEPEAVGFYHGFGMGELSAHTSRNAEIEAMKAEIESLRCCGNCDNLRATPQDHDFCWNNNGNLPSERICKYWTRKTK